MSKRKVKEFIEFRLNLRKDRGLPIDENSFLICYLDIGMFTLLPVQKVVLPIIYDLRLRSVMDKWLGHFESLGWTVVHIEPKVTIMGWSSMTDREHERIGRPIELEKQNQYQERMTPGKPRVNVFLVENDDRVKELIKDFK